jgi:hypothetical protein
MISFKVAILANRPQEFEFHFLSPAPGDFPQMNLITCRQSGEQVSSQIFSFRQPEAEFIISSPTETDG